jgi:TPR repeat protein
LFRKAALHGLARAQVALGNLHAEGLLGAKNLVEAHAWFNLGAAQPGEAQARARTFLDKATRRMSADQIARAGRRLDQLRMEMAAIQAEATRHQTAF